MLKEKLQREVLAVRHEVLGDTHPAYAMSLHHIAVNLAKRVELSEAESLERRAVEILLWSHGADHRDYTNSLNHLAVVLTKLGKGEQAEPLYRTATVIRWRLFRQALSELIPDYRLVWHMFSSKYERSANNE